MIIGVDMDSVIAEIFGAMDLFHNRTYGTKIQYEDHSIYNLSIVWNCNNNETFKRIFEFYESEEFSNITPIVGSQKALINLSKKNSLHLITSRPYSIEKKSIKWLNTFFPTIFNSIHHTNQISEQGFGNGIKKSAICKKIHADIMIDDHIENVLDCADNEIKTILFPGPWNKTFNTQHAFIQKVNSWNDVETTINGSKPKNC